MRAARISPSPLRGALAAAGVLALVGAGVIAAVPAAAATTIAVSTTADGDANDACSTAGVTTTANPVTLRNALCVASNLGGEVTVTVPADTYTLTDGALTLGTQQGTDVTLESSGGRAEIVGDESSQILTLDPDLVGGIDVEITGFAFTGGRDDVFGGGAIVGGSFDGEPDSLTVQDSVFTDNRSTGGTANPGGAIQFIGGALTITDSIFENNDSGTASGGAIYYEATDAADTFTVTGSTFRENTAAAAGTVATGGGAIAFDAANLGTVSITGNTFTENAVTSTGPAARGGAIQQVRGPATISKNVFLRNSAGGAAAGGGAIDATNGALTAQFNSFAGNTGSAALLATASAPTSAENNWWGANGGAGATGADTASVASGETTPYLTFTASASTSAVDVSGSTALTASLRTNSAGTALAPSALSGLDGTIIAWTDVLPSGATVTPTVGSLFSGTATATYTAGTTPGAGGVTATYDAASVDIDVNVRQAPAFTSADTAPATLGSAFVFTVQASGFPVPTVSLASGALPSGLQVTDTAPGSLTISGTPMASGTFTVELEATNGTDTATQTLTLNVGAAPTITGPLTASVADGEAVDVTIFAAGIPVPEISAIGTLPAGLALDDGEDGTARLHGTPTDGPGVYAIGLSAENTVGTRTATFTLTVTAPPAFTSEDRTTFTVGEAGSFAIGVDGGYPVKETVSLEDAPAWLTLIGDPGDQHLTGTPPIGAGGEYDVLLAIDGSTVTQDFTLTVLEAPVVTTQPDDATVVEGADATFTAAASGFPAPTVQWQLFTDGDWTDIDDATDTTLAFEADIDDDGTRYRAVFTNDAGDTTTDEATLTVGQLPVLDDIDPVTAPVGDEVTIDIAASGLPASTITTSTLPAWLTLTDAGDGTATLTGTPGLADAGQVEITVTADNGFGTDDITVTITVVGAVPAFTSGLDATVARGDDVDVTITAGGTPTPEITVTGALPAGLAFEDAEDGTATLTGTATAAPGVHTIALTAANTHGSVDATFTLTVTAPPAFTSEDRTTFTVGEAGSFAIGVDGGYPVKQTVSLEDAPAWLTLIGDPGDQHLTGTPPTGAGREYEVELSVDGSTVTQDFTLTVLEAPAVTTQPEDLTVLAGTDVEFTAAASGFPTPTVQWQRLDDGDWTDIDDATDTTLAFEADITDDGTRYRAVFSNDAGDTTTDETTLTVGQIPALDDIDPVDVLAGGTVQIAVASTGHPVSTLAATGVPAWLTFTDAGDGTATLTGTPALTDAGEVEITVTADNGFGTDDITITVTVADTVDLPETLTAPDGALEGVPATTTREQVLTVTGAGYLPGAEIALGIYSTPTALGTVTADADGAFEATIAIPADQSFGDHTVAAIGIGADGSSRLLTAATEVVDPSTGGSDGGSTGTADGGSDGAANGGADGSGTGGLGATGLDTTTTIVLTVVAVIVLLGGGLLVWRSRRRNR